MTWKTPSVLVISDASPLIALIAIGKINLLSEMYSEVWITDVVQAEVRAELPPWIVVKTTYSREEYNKYNRFLDAGEASAIALAISYPPATLLIDERAGRKVAQELNISVTGVVGIIIAANGAGLIPRNSSVIEDLEQHGFWLSKKLKAQLVSSIRNE